MAFFKGCVFVLLISSPVWAETTPVAELSGTVRWKNNKLDRFVRGVYRLTFDRPSRVFEATVLTFNSSGNQGELVLPMAADWRAGDSVSVVVREFKFSVFPEFDSQNLLPMEAASLVENEFTSSNLSGREIGQVLLGADGKFKFGVVRVPVGPALNVPFQVMISPFSKSSPASDSRDPFINLLITDPMWQESAVTAGDWSSWGVIKCMFRLP